MTSGRLCGLGVGPGDPELLTLKALRLLRAAPVVAYPAPDIGSSFARAIVAEWLDRGQREIAIRFPMRPGPPPEALYDEAAARLAALLDQGDDITLAEDELARRLAASEAAAVIKLGRHFTKLRRVLVGLGLLDRAVYIERASLPNQRIEALAQVDPASVPYFATALVWRGGSGS